MSSLVRISRWVEWGAHRPPSGARRYRSTAEARTAFHNRGDDVSRSYREPRICPPPIYAGPRPESIGGPARRRSTSNRGALPAPIRFPPDNFKNSLTVFSKSFSSFPRGFGHNESLTLSGASFQGTWARRSTGPLDARRGRGARGRLSIQVFLGAFRARVHWSPSAHAEARAPGMVEGARAECRSTPPAHTPQLLNAFAGSFCCAGFDNDPSAGSPMETLIRFNGLLAMSWATNCPRRRDPNISPDHSICRSNGRGVQRAGT
ncbi:hypothetical protein CQW23_05428 [Capsicum baccatum]|uniref:Protein TAR1 n=1 Tax=Capsicum baccatum TaxID=33114 RepID=A0A2G2XHG8_CAPBA|nr:hypothetical protein CQW23_05428 [Capsicum baccatum]